MLTHRIGLALPDTLLLLAGTLLLLTAASAQQTLAAGTPDTSPGYILDNAACDDSGSLASPYISGNSGLSLSASPSDNSSPDSSAYTYGISGSEASASPSDNSNLASSAYAYANSGSDASASPFDNSDSEASASPYGNSRSSSAYDSDNPSSSHASDASHSSSSYASGNTGSSSAYASGNTGSSSAYASGNTGSSSAYASGKTDSSSAYTSSEIVTSDSVSSISTFSNGSTASSSDPDTSAETTPTDSPDSTDDVPEKERFVFLDGILYDMEALADAPPAYTGIYEEHYYFNGKILKKSCLVVFHGKLYHVSSKGKATLYQEEDQGKDSDKTFLILARNSKGCIFLYRITRKTSEAEKYCKDKKKSGFWLKEMDGVLYRIAYKTGRARTFTGIHENYFYRKGKILTPQKARYKVINGYLYQISTKGKVSIYIRSAVSSGTYEKRISGVLYYVYYKTGKILYTIKDIKQRDAVLDVAAGWVGCKESNGSHRKIIDIFNRYPYKSRNYKMSYTDPWCATYVSACAIAAGKASGFALECSCQNMVILWKKMGRWEEDDAYIPRPGDVILYDWDDSGSGDCKGHPDHVGIVEKVQGTTITVLEGNYSNAVGRRHISINAKHIRGYGLPKYS